MDQSCYRSISSDIHDMNLFRAGGLGLGNQLYEIMTCIDEEIGLKKEVSSMLGKKR